MMNYANLWSGVRTNTLPPVVTSADGSVTHNPPWEVLRSLGWRRLVEEDTAEEGYVITASSLVELNADECAFRITEVKSAAAMNAELADVPLVYDRPIQARLETPAGDGHVYGVEVDPVTDSLVPVQRQSTRLTAEEYAAAKAAKLAARKTLKDAGVAGINGQLQARIENIERFLGWRK